MEDVKNQNPKPLSLGHTAWLIESTFSGRTYWHGKRPGFVERWVDDANYAVRYARREDAEMARILFDNDHASGHMTKVTEHVWLESAHQPGKDQDPIDKPTKHRILGDLANIEISLDNIKSSPTESVFYHAEEIRKSINKIKELLKND